MSRADELLAQASEVLKERARRAALRREADEEEALVQVAEFPVGTERCAIPLESLRACIPLKGVTAVPLSRPEVVGILRWHGAIVTVFSLAALMGTRGWRQDPATLLVIENEAGGLVAVDCEQIPKAAALPARPVEKARSETVGAVATVTLGDLSQVHLLDVGRLVAQRTGSQP